MKYFSPYLKKSVDAETTADAVKKIKDSIQENNPKLYAQLYKEQNEETKTTTPKPAQEIENKKVENEKNIENQEIK